MILYERYYNIERRGDCLILAVEWPRELFAIIEVDCFDLQEENVREK
jgi:hypothetical protein